MNEDNLLPTAGSAGMERVVDHAASLVAVHDATLHGLYVAERVVRESAVPVLTVHVE